MRQMLSVVGALAVYASTAMAQAPEPKPGPEHKRMGYFVGQWSYEGEAKPSPMGPAGKTTGTETCEWFAGGFQVVCRSKGTGPRGPVTGQSTIGYDPSRKAYTFFAISSLGDNIFIRGNVDGKVWTWTEESTMEGKPVKIRATVTEDSPTTYSFKLEGSFGDGPMTVFEEGKATKRKAG